jgi:methionyl-tRNA formyltransferase
VKFLVLGRTAALHLSALALVATGRHRIGAVVTAPAAPESDCREDDFAALARDAGVPFRLASRQDPQTARMVEESGCEIGISINWTSVIDAAFLGLLPRGVLNAHYGDLPRFRGNAVVNWAILLGEPHVMLTIHQMEAGALDSGAIVAQDRIELGADTSVGEVLRQADGRVPELFVGALDGLAAGTLQPRPQALDPRTPFRCYPRLPRDGQIDWTQSALRIHALVRAVAEPFAGAFTHYRTPHDVLEPLHIWRSRVVAEHTDDVAVPGQLLRNDPQTGESWVMTGAGVLALREVSHGPTGEHFLPGRVWRSIRVRLGMDVEGEILRLLSGSR